MTATDQHFMDLALRMGRRNTGATAENPSVGCLVAKAGKVVGRGVTAKGGRPHAETQALAQAGDQARGADVFVTLEPCAHHGKTPPCCDALIEAGVRRVVIALTDPDPRTAGQGIDRLQAAGIVVEHGVLEHEGRADLAGYLSRVERRRPWVVLKLAVSSDGMMAEAPAVQTAITQTAALRQSQIMRAQSDGILVGAGTVRVDDPSLTCRLKGLEAQSPVRIVMGARQDTLQGTKLAETANTVPVWCLGAIECEGDIKQIACRTDEAGQINPADALSVLAERGIGRLLVEGGAKVARSFLEADLVDQIAVFTAPHALGPGGLAAPLELLTKAHYVASEPIMLGVDELTVYDRV